MTHVVEVPSLAQARSIGLRRNLIFDSVEVRAEEGDGPDAPIRFRGHAAVFDEWAQIGGPVYGFMERVQRGAFRKVLTEKQDVRFLGLNHDPSTVMARTTNGTLKLKEDPKGLLVEADLAPTQGARDLAILLERGDVSQMSFGFDVGAHEVEEVDGEMPKRTITEFAGLYDVSPVTYPAYEGTDAQLRASGLFDRIADLDPGAVPPEILAVIAAGDQSALSRSVDDALAPLAPVVPLARLHRSRRLQLLETA